MTPIPSTYENHLKSNSEIYPSGCTWTLSVDVNTHNCRGVYSIMLDKIHTIETKIERFIGYIGTVGLYLASWMTKQHLVDPPGIRKLKQCFGLISFWSKPRTCTRICFFNARSPRFSCRLAGPSLHQRDTVSVILRGQLVLIRARINKIYIM